MLLATYTNKVKDYCERQFFDRFLSYEADKIIVDNTAGTDYYHHLQEIAGADVVHVDVKREPLKTRFLRNVTESANYIRDYFLDNDYRYLIIIESDVIPPKDLLSLFDDAMYIANFIHDVKGGKNWGAIGGIYYDGFHDFSKAGEDTIVEKPHVLSGCTLYKRELLEKHKFRWSYEDIGAFPDAWICHDSPEYIKYDYYKIVCDHLKDADGRRGQQKLYSQ